MAEHARPAPSTWPAYAHGPAPAHGPAQTLTDGGQPVASTSTSAAAAGAGAAAGYANPDSGADGVNGHLYHHHHAHQQPHHHQQQQYDPNQAGAYPTVAEQAAPPLLEYDSAGRFRLPAAFEGGLGQGQAQDRPPSAAQVHHPHDHQSLHHLHHPHPHLHMPHPHPHAAYHYWPTPAPPAPPAPVADAGAQHRTEGGHDAGWPTEERRYGEEVHTPRGEDRHGAFGDHSYRERLAAARLSGYNWDWQRQAPQPPPPPPPQMPGYPTHHSGAPAHRDSVPSLKRSLHDDAPPLPLSRSLSIPDVRSHLSRASSIWGPPVSSVAAPSQNRHSSVHALNLPKVGPLTTHSPLVVRPTSPAPKHPALSSLSRSISPASRASTPTHASELGSAPAPHPHALLHAHAHVTDPRSSAPLPNTDSDSDPDAPHNLNPDDPDGRKRRKRRRRLTETPRDVASRKFGCATCGKMFARPSALATHERSHSKEKPHGCPIAACGRAFAVSSNLRRHQTIYDHWSSAEEKEMFEKRPKGVARGVDGVEAKAEVAEGEIGAKRDDREDSHD